MAQTLRALPTHASDISLKCSSLPTAQLNQLAQISDHLHPLVSGQKLDTEEQTEEAKINKEEGTALEVTGATD